MTKKLFLIYMTAFPSSFKETYYAHFKIGFHALVLKKKH